MKKIRRIKISLTTREVLAMHSETCDVPVTTRSQLCPACHSRIAEAVDSAFASQRDENNLLLGAGPEHKGELK